MPAHASLTNLTNRIKRLAAFGTLGVLTSAVFSVASAAPAQMKAIVQHGIGGPEVLRLEQVPVPQPEANQVRVRVYAAGVNPADYAVRTGQFGRRPGAAGPPPTIRPGADIAGVVDALGSGVTQFKVGEAVYAYLFGPLAVPGNGGYAQYTVVKVSSLAPKPKSLTFEQAAGAPESGTTALRTLNDANVQSGQTVVVIGAAGGVGSDVVQLAKGRGARVIAIASSQHNAFLKRLGADEIVNYDKQGSVGDVRDADVVINTVPGQAVAALAYVKRGGAMVSIAGARPTADQCAAAGATCPNEQGGGGQGGPSAAEQLTELGRLIDAGKLTVHVEKTFTLAGAADAQEFNHAGHAEGKVVLVMTAAARRR